MSFLIEKKLYFNILVIRFFFKRRELDTGIVYDYIRSLLT